MRYILMICADESQARAMSRSELDECDAFVEDMGRRGVLRGGERLRWTSRP